MGIAADRKYSPAVEAAPRPAEADMFAGLTEAGEPAAGPASEAELVGIAAGRTQSSIEAAAEVVAGPAGTPANSSEFLLLVILLRGCVVQATRLLMKLYDGQRESWRCQGLNQPGSQ